MPTDISVIKALLPILAAGFAVQRLLEILDPLIDTGLIKFGGERYKKHILGILSLIVGIVLAVKAKLQILLNLGISTTEFTIYLDYFVTGLVVSAGTDGINSILKFLSYKKDEQKEETKVEMMHAATTRATFESRSLSSLRLGGEIATAGEFIISNDLAKDLARALKDEIRKRFPDQFNENGFEDRAFSAYVTGLTLFKVQDAVLTASNIVARAYGVELSNEARLRIQNRVSTGTTPKKILPVMEDEVASA